jgi:hypothetical protein
VLSLVSKIYKSIQTHLLTQSKTEEEQSAAEN